MAITLEMLEKRLTTLEHDVAWLRQMLGQPAEQRAKNGPVSIQETNQAAISFLVEQAYEEMGVRGQPVSAQKLREMFVACGIKPEDNTFSREIIEMREE